MLKHALVALLCLSMLPAQLRASSEPEASAPDAHGFKYVEMTPPLVVNVGETGRVGFLKAEVSLRVQSAALGSVELHMPALRHELILLLSRQNQQSLQDAPVREALRLEALESMRKVIKDADGAEGITDLLFTSFLVTR